MKQSLNTYAYIKIQKAGDFAIEDYGNLQSCLDTRIELLSSACRGTGQENQTTSKRTREDSRWTQVVEEEACHLWSHTETKVRRGMGKPPTPSWTRQKPTGGTTLDIKTSNKQWPAKWNPKTASKNYRKRSARIYRKREDLIRGPRGHWHRVKMTNFKC